MDAYGRYDTGIEPSNRRLEWQLAQERETEYSLQLEQDESRYQRLHKPKLSREKARLALSSNEVALERLECVARTVEDFELILAIWDRRDANRERRERYREVRRGNNVPLEYGAAYDGVMFPRFLMNPAYRQLCSGNFLDVLFDCPYEMHQLTADNFKSDLVYKLNENQKEVLFFLAAIRGQTDRNIRSVRDGMLQTLQKRLYRHLKKWQTESRQLTLREEAFIGRYEANALDEDTSG